MTNLAVNPSKDTQAIINEYLPLLRQYKSPGGAPQQSPTPQQQPPPTGPQPGGCILSVAHGLKLYAKDGTKNWRLGMTTSLDDENDHWAIVDDDGTTFKLYNIGRGRYLSMQPPVQGNPKTVVKTVSTGDTDFEKWHRTSNFFLDNVAGSRLQGNSVTKMGKKGQWQQMSSP